MEGVTFIPAGSHERRQPARPKERPKSPKMNVEALQRADEAQARRGRPAWRRKIEAEAAQRGQETAGPPTRVVEIILRKGSAGYTKQPDPNDVTLGLEQKGKLRQAQAWAIERFLEEADLDGIESAWENGELKLADLARRAVEIYGHKVTRYVPEIDALTRKATGEPAWKS